MVAGSRVSVRLLLLFFFFFFFFFFFLSGFFSSLLSGSAGTRSETITADVECPNSTHSSSHVPCESASVLLSSPPHSWQITIPSDVSLIRVPVRPGISQHNPQIGSYGSLPIAPSSPPPPPPVPHSVASSTTESNFLLRVTSSDTRELAIARTHEMSLCLSESNPQAHRQPTRENTRQQKGER